MVSKKLMAVAAVVLIVGVRFICLVKTDSNLETLLNVKLFVSDFRCACPMQWSRGIYQSTKRDADHNDNVIRSANEPVCYSGNH